MAGVSAAVPAQDATVTYKDNGSGFVVTAKDGNAAYEMMLGSCWAKSFASSPTLAAGRASLSIGGASIGSDLFSPRKIPAVDGAIGMDLLAGLALGFDLYDHKLAIWPRGASAKDALDWVTHADGWSRFGAETAEIPLDIDPVGLPVVRLTALGAERKALLMIMTNASTVFGAPDVAAESSGPGAFIDGVRIGPEPIPWMRDSKTINGGRSPYPRFNVNAMLSLEDLLSPRVVVDFPTHKIYIRRMGLEGRLTMMLDGLLRAPVMFASSGIKLGGPMLPEDAGIAAYDGCKVSKIADVPEATVRKMLVDPSPESRKWLNGFLAKVRGDYSLRVVTQGGAEVEIKVSA